MTEEEQEVIETTQEEEAAPENPDALELVTRAEDAANRLEDVNRRIEANIIKLERQKTEVTLAGRSAATRKPKAETAEEYSERMLRGEL